MKEAIKKIISKKAKERWKNPHYRRHMHYVRKALWKNKEFRKTTTAAIKNSKNTLSAKKHISIIMKRKWKEKNYREKTSKAISKGKKERCKNLEFKTKTIGAMNKARQTAWEDKKRRKIATNKMSCSQKKLFNNKNTRQKALQHIFDMQHKHISSFEKKIIKIIKVNQLPWKFIGNGKLILAEKNPDFVHLKKKIVCEAYTKYYKQKDYGSTNRYEKLRAKIFEKCGYKTIFITENDTETLIVKKLKRA